MVRSTEAYVVRAAANVGAGAAITTSSVYCYGARMVAFIFTTTAGSNAMASGTVEVSMDNTNWTTAATAGGCAASSIPTGGVTAGGVCVALSGPTAVGGAVIPFKYARFNGVGHASGHTGMAVVADVYEQP